MTLNKEIIFFRSDIPQDVYLSISKNLKFWGEVKKEIISRGYIIIEPLTKKS